MKKGYLILMAIIAVFLRVMMISTNGFAYCTPDNDTCFDCGTNCIAELSFEDVVQEDGTNKNVGTFTVYGTGANGTGEMKNYTHIYNPSNPGAGNRITRAPWADKINQINNIVISEGISNVGKNAFTGAKNLDQLELPQSVHNIDDGAFLDSNLKSINTLQHVSSIGDGAFERTSLNKIDLSDDLERIETWAFALIRPLKDVVIPDSVTDIDPDAFYDLSSLKVYCNNIGGRCDQLFAAEKNTGIELKNVIKYERVGSGYFINGKWYQSPDDIVNGKPVKKRIYTLEEAQTIVKAIGKDHVSFRIRYK